MPGRLENPGEAPSAAVSFLRERHEQLLEQYSSITFDLPPGIIHGDAHRANVIVTETGPHLCDFEVVATGPREWDLTPTAVGKSRFNLSDSEYHDFVTAYGYDVTTWANFPIMRDVRELTMTTWLMQNVSESPGILAEFISRVASMQADDHTRRWYAF